MSDSCVLYDNRSERVISALLPPCGQLRPENSYMDPDVASNTPKTSSCRRNLFRVFICIVALGVVYMAGFATSHFSASEKILPGTGQTAAQTGNNVYYSGKTETYLNNPNVTNCGEEGSSCTQCKKRVKRLHNLGKPQHCPEDVRVINASCFNCNGDCKTLEELQSLGGRCRVDCCITAQMGNAGKVCGEGGQYNCYMDALPKCQCPVGRKGDRCQFDTFDTFKCRCFTPAYPFCGGEEIEDCNKPGLNKSVSQCQMKVSRSDKLNNCICDETTGESDSEDYEDCQVPKTESQTSSSAELKLDYWVFLCLLMVITVLNIVDKT